METKQNVIKKNQFLYFFREKEKKVSLKRKDVHI